MTINTNSPWYKKPTDSDEQKAPSLEELVPAIEQMARSLIAEAKSAEDAHTKKGTRGIATNNGLRYSMIARSDQFETIEKTILPTDAQQAKPMSQRQRECIDVVEAATSLKARIEADLERFYQLFLLADRQGLPEYGTVKMDEIISKIGGLAKLQDNLPKPEAAANTGRKHSSPWGKLKS